tara:strand:+ start:1178 stop:1456 length:279 start_codon:yes stop_codon:yes gene_type:complete
MLPPWPGVLFVTVARIELGLEALANVRHAVSTDGDASARDAFANAFALAKFVRAMFEAAAGSCHAAPDVDAEADVAARASKAAAARRTAIVG